MFIPQAKPYSPAEVGVNSTAVTVLAGRLWLILKSGNITREEQSPLSCRSNSNRTGIPAWTSMRSGL